MEGFSGIDYPSRVPEALEALARWQRDGKLVQKAERSGRPRECAANPAPPVLRREFRQAAPENCRRRELA
jgi:hypothetical protein